MTKQWLIFIEENLSLLSQKIDFLGVLVYYGFRIISEKSDYRRMIYTVSALERDGVIR